MVASSEFVIFIVSLFFCFENSEVWLFWVINIILLDWIIGGQNVTSAGLGDLPFVQNSQDNQYH